VTTVRVALPSHLRTLARIDGDVAVDVSGDPTIGTVLDALEASYPVLRGTIRDHGTLRRRAFMRYFASEQDLSHDPLETPLPESVTTGKDVFRVVAAIAGG
jgi:hypothetical protein